MEKWNSENMIYINSDEYKYLTEINKLISKSKDITKLLKEINNFEHFNIQSDSVKNKADFSVVEQKLNEVYQILNEM